MSPVIKVTVDSAEPFRGSALLEDAGPRAAARFESWLEFLRIVSDLLADPHVQAVRD